MTDTCKRLISEFLCKFKEENITQVNFDEGTFHLVKIFCQTICLDTFQSHANIIDKLRLNPQMVPKEIRANLLVKGTTLENEIMMESLNEIYKDPVLNSLKTWYLAPMD